MKPRKHTQKKFFFLAKFGLVLTLTTEIRERIAERQIICRKYFLRALYVAILNLMLTERTNTKRQSIP